MVASHPVSASWGRVDVVRKANGKNRRKLEVDRARAAGLQGDGVGEAGEGEAPQAADEDEGEDAEHAGLEADAGGQAEASTGTQSPHTSAKSATISPSSRAGRLIGRQQQPVEVAVLDVGDEGGGPGDAGDGEDDRHRELERLEVEARRCPPG